MPWLALEWTVKKEHRKWIIAKQPERQTQNSSWLSLGFDLRFLKKREMLGMARGTRILFYKSTRNTASHCLLGTLHARHCPRGL